MKSLIPFYKKGREDWFGVPGMLDNLFHNFFEQNGLFPKMSSQLVPFRIDVRETENEYLIDAEIPGVERNMIRLSADEERLYLEVNREENASQEEGDYVHRERNASSMCRCIRLIDGAMEKIQAKLENGILHIRVGKKATAKPRQSIKID